MKKLSIGVALLLLGCASDEVVLRPLPPAGEPSAEVTVIRPRAMVQAEWPFYIVVADQPVFDLRNGENTRFRISSGPQPLAIRCLGGPVSKPLEVRLDHVFPPGGRAYFVVEPKFDCVSVRGVDAREAASLLATTRYRALGSVNPIAQAHGEAPAVFSSQPAPAAPVPATPQAQVAAATAAWIEAFNSRDSAHIASLYDSDAVLRDGTGQRLAAGPGGIAEYLRSATPASIGEREIRVFGDTAVDAGPRHNIVYRNRGGKWLIIDQTLR